MLMCGDTSVRCFVVSLICVLKCGECHFRAYPIEAYPCKTKSAAAIMLMIMNNLDPSVAQVSCSDNKGSWSHEAEANLQVTSCKCSHTN